MIIISTNAVTFAYQYCIIMYFCLAGIYFPKYNPIPWTAVTCANGSEHLYNYNPKRQQVGKSLVLEQASDASTKPCRHYSLNATIINDEGM